MSGFEAWIGNCHLRQIEGEEEYQCQAAVWADSYDSFRARLAQHIQSSGLKILWLEECHPVSQYLQRHGNPHKIGALARAVHPYHLVELGPLSLKGGAEENAPVEVLSLPETLLAIDYKTAPAFAVLDGAQFDNLPKSLFDGDFVSRPLYLDRGENDPEQIITAPHMVWIDERSEKVTGRSPAETIPALFDLIDDKPAAVFWQCPDGGNALYKHLRSINMVLYPKAAFPDWEEPEPPEGEEAKPPDTHTMVLFRNADANVLMQTLYAMIKEEVARFYGPATALLFQPSPEWRGEQAWLKLDRPDNLPAAPRGPLRLCMETVERIGQKRVDASTAKICTYLRRVVPEKTEALNDEQLTKQTLIYIEEAKELGVTSEAAFGRWCYLQFKADGKMIEAPHIRDCFNVPDTPPNEAVQVILRHTIQVAKEQGI